MSSDPKHLAAEALAAGLSNNQASKRAGVNRSTVGRWLEDPDFQALVEELRGSQALEALSGLSSLVPAALKILQDALSGDSDVSAARAGVALNVVKAAASLSKGDEGAGESTLESRIKELDGRLKSDGDDSPISD